MKLTFLRADDRIEGLSVDESSVLAPAPVGAMRAPRRAGSTLSDQWRTQKRDVDEATADDQFFALYLDPKSKGLVIPLSNKVEPQLEGKTDTSDVEMLIELDALHLPGKGVRSGSIRIQVSQDGRFLQGRDALHWVVAAGLDLYRAATKGDGKVPLKPDELKADLIKPFAGRPVSLPGGAGYVKVDVMQDKELSVLENIWASVVSLFKTPQGMALAAIVGFPALGLPAVAFVDQLIEKYRSSTGEAVIGGKQMRWAFNKSALQRMKLSSGDLVELPVMNTGYFVMVPAGRVSEVMKTQPRYVSGYGYLFPSSVDMSDQAAIAAYLDQVSRGEYPYYNLPYAVLAVELRETNSWKNW